MDKLKSAIIVDSLLSKSTNSSSSTTATTYPTLPAAALTTTPNQIPDLRIRTVHTRDYKAAAATLANAFSADDSAAYFFDCPDTAAWSPARKWALHVKILEAIVYAHCKCGLVQAIGDPSAASSNDGSEGEEGSFDAVALWMPPGTSMDGLATTVRKGLWRRWLGLRWRLSREGSRRFFGEFVPLLHVTKEDVLKERDPMSWYLVYLGTHQRARGRGLATRLVEEVTRKADADSRACYLESTNVANLPLYRRLGFVSCKTIKLARGQKDVGLDIMVREPIPISRIG